MLFLVIQPASDQPLVFACTAVVLTIHCIYSKINGGHKPAMTWWHDSVCESRGHCSMQHEARRIKYKMVAEVENEMKKCRLKGRNPRAVKLGKEMGNQGGRVTQEGRQLWHHW